MGYTKIKMTMETLGQMNFSAYEFFEILGGKITDAFGDRR